MTQITKNQLAAIKRIAMIILPLNSKKERLAAKIAALNEEIESLDSMIAVQEEYAKNLSGGKTTSELVIRNDKKNAFIANPEVLVYNEEKHVYLVKENTEEEEVITEKLRMDAQALEAEVDNTPVEEKKEGDVVSAEEVFKENTAVDNSYDPFNPEN